MFGGQQRADVSARLVSVRRTLLHESRSLGVMLVP
jgi:hypothetical protein